MTTSPNIRPNTCPRCGARLAEHARLGFCSRCLAATSLTEAEPEAASEEDLAAVLPKTVAPARQQTRFGDYELLEEIARGGMGVVYRARQRSLNRTVAVKMLLFGGLAGPEKLRRFRAEAAAAAGLDHPNIVRILDAGEQDGQPFLAMEYVAGRDLAQLVSDRPLPARQAAGYVQKITRAIAFAHAHGVLHRDLKPSNVLINAFDEPQLTDFGLARQLAADSDLTHSGQVLGSSNFMPPEQCGIAADVRRRNSTPERDDRLLTSSGTNPRFGPWSDVYGLGAILYHLLTGRPPFLADTFEATLRQVLEHAPAPPRQLNPQIPRDLETICLKCLEKEPTKRYATAQQLADDLERFLKDEPIHARPVTRAERAWRWCRRKPALATALLFVLVLVLVIGIGSPIAAYRINQERRYAQAQAYTSDMNLVQQAWAEGNLQRAQDLLRAHIPKPAEEDLRGFEWRYLSTLCRDESRFTYTNFSSADILLEISRAGDLLAAASRTQVSLLDPKSDREIARIACEDSIGAIAFSPVQGLLALLAGETNGIQLWDTRQLRLVTRFGRTYPKRPAVAFSPDGNLLAVSGNKNAVELWDLRTRQMRWSQTDRTPPHTIAFAKTGDALVTAGGYTGNLLLWDVQTGERTPFPLEHTGFVPSLSLAPDGQTLASCSADGQIIVWDFPARSVRFRLANSVPFPVALSPDGEYLAFGTSGGAIHLWSMRKQTEVALLRGHTASLSSLVFSPDGHSLYSADYRNPTVKCWTLPPTSSVETLHGHAGWLQRVAFSPDGKLLASVEPPADRVKLWNVASRSLITNLQSTVDPWVAAFSPDGQLLAVGAYQNIRLWDLKTLQVYADLTNDTWSNFSISFSPDASLLAAASANFIPRNAEEQPTLRLWDLSARRLLPKLRAAATNAASVAFSHDGTRIAVGYFDGVVRVWDCKREICLRTCAQHRELIWFVAFSHDDNLVASASQDGEVGLYDLRSDRSSTLREHSDRVWSVLFTPDHKTLISTSQDGTIKLWNLATGQTCLTLREGAGEVTSVALDPSATLMATCGGDATVRLWPAASIQELSQNNGLNLNRK